MSKKRNKVPRRKRMTRPTRLQNARKWLPTYKGKTPVRGYAKWYGVDALCAIIELRLLGVSVPEKQWERAQQRQKSKPTTKQRNREEKEVYSNVPDDNFACIAGHTSGGFPYGITWEEMELIEERTHVGSEDISYYSKEPSDGAFSHIQGIPIFS